jgi:hypothetical protein
VICVSSPDKFLSTVLHQEKWHGRRV